MKETALFALAKGKKVLYDKANKKVTRTESKKEERI